MSVHRRMVPAVMFALALLMLAGLTASAIQHAGKPYQGAVVAEVTVKNVYGMPVTLHVDCGPGKWRARHLPRKGKAVLMLNSRKCAVTPYIGRRK